MSCAFIDFLPVALVLFKCTSVLKRTNHQIRQFLYHNFTVESIQLIPPIQGSKPYHTDYRNHHATSLPPMFTGLYFYKGQVHCFCYLFWVFSKLFLLCFWRPVQTAPDRNLKTEVPLWKHIKCSRSTLPARAGIQNTTITGYFGFFFDENLVWDMARHS